MGKITINGKSIEFLGKSLSVSLINGVLKIKTDKGEVNRNVTEEESKAGMIKLVIEGAVGDITTDGDVECKDVNGNIDAGGSVSCQNVRGDIDCGGSVNSGNVEGSIDCGGSVNTGSVGGNIDAGGSVIVNR